MFRQPYFEPSPKEEREAALNQLPELLKRFTTRDLGYSFKANEVHWRRFPKYMDDEVAKYILVDFCRLTNLKAIIGRLPANRLSGVDNSTMLAEDLEQLHISLHCDTLRQRMQQVARFANLDLDVRRWRWRGGGGAAN
eukprot:INCI3237.2.p4 GENE.INCI3237.2~~INCI3237.2.p4  ORF type:complete len:138 (+),score=31.11 INCI3237.2:1245-1658(+)